MYTHSQIFIEFLLCVNHYSNDWGYSGEKKYAPSKKNPCPNKNIYIERDEEVGWGEKEREKEKV